MRRHRKYYRVKALRIPPHSWANKAYYIEEDLYAYSEYGATYTFYNYHKHSFGGYSIEDIKEIPKEEFRGHHHSEVIGE